MRLIIGCGNILLGDEGIGVHLIEELKKRKLPQGVELLDGGTAGYELIPYIRQAEKIIIVDAVKGQGRPGQIYRFSPGDYEQEQLQFGSFSLHEVSLKDVFTAIKNLGIQKEIIIFGIEPQDIGVKIGLSQKLTATLPQLIDLVLQEASDRG
jgi:hydrogenase maturation protease